MWISENKLLFKILLSSFMMIFLFACSGDSDEKNVDQFTNVTENASSQNNNNETETNTKKTDKIELALERLEVLKNCKCEEYEELKELIDKI